jgi:hypothetical protein
MNDSQQFFASFVMDIPDDWFDVTESLAEGTPPTLGREQGPGALQFSLARFKGGVEPEFDENKLLAMLREFVATNDLGDALSEASGAVIGEMSHATGTYVSGIDLTAVWYLSNGRDVMLVTYCADDALLEAAAELAQVREIVRSIRL